jgi:hypothetical protein
MKNTIFLLSVLIIGILLFGCASQQVSHNGEDNISVQPNITTQQNTTVKPGAFEFSVPSELPVAYVGKPYFYSICDPQPTGTNQYGNKYNCGENVISINPKGGKPPYDVSINQYNANPTKSLDWSVTKLYSDVGILNFTPKTGDEGQYVLEVCTTDRSDPRNQVCKNTTIYIMSDTVTVKGEGELTHDLLLQVASDAQAADFVVPDRHKDTKEIATQYVPAANFSPLKVTAEVPASSQCGNTVGLEWCGAGSYTEVDVTASATGASMTVEGSAPCGKSYGSAYNVDYYHAGFYTVGDYVISNSNNNIDLALNITNTGTEEKAIDVYLKVSSELDPGSQHYFKPAAARAEAFVGSWDHRVSVPNAQPGEVLVNSTAFRVLVRPGSHWVYIGGMKDSVDNTNMASCPSFVKASSSVSVTIVPADMGDGKKAIGRIYSSSKGADFRKSYSG